MSEWIAVEDREPPKGRNVLIYISQRECTEPYVTMWRADEDGVWGMSHWMPLPEPPREERRDCVHYLLVTGRHKMCKVGIDPTLNFVDLALLRQCEYGSSWCKYAPRKPGPWDCEHYRQYDTEIWCSALAPGLHPEDPGARRCEYFAPWCKYERKGGEKPDCVHYGLSAYGNPGYCHIDWSPCDPTASWCEYKPPELRDDLTALQLKVTALEHRLRNHRHYYSLPDKINLTKTGTAVCDEE